jgi:hypothetical protein
MEIERILPFVVMPVLLAAIVAIWHVVRRAEQKRRQALRQLAEQLGLEFAEEAGELTSSEFARFHLFKQGRGRRASNLMRGRVGRDEVLLFDYRYVIGSGKNRRTVRQSVAAFSLGPLTLPDFELRPESLFHKIGAAFGYQDIDFPDYPSFSSHYLVRGKDEPAVRGLLDGTVIESVQAAKGICIEGGGSWLVVYRAGRRVDPLRMSEFLDEAQALRSAFGRRLDTRRR